MTRSDPPELVTAAGGAPPAGPYSPALRLDGLLYVSGQAPFGPDGQRLGTTFTEQAHVVFDNIARLVDAAGTSLAHAVKLTAYLSDWDLFQEWNAVCAARLAEPYPVRTTLPIALVGFDIEVDAIIRIPPAG
jgi:enamine deaminase RidA (YjgF/YER057c/UK114 family)